ncbi:histone-lysine N-methyltransferase SETDB1-A-like [Cheilinus undulatus]|uniref:histone-lysine N-methyltransferase SETDB1-A-like n=1 Tax=Cheilinus undulatus TaxID=241271 RepID=UPI001BD24982|nr:histone-lysine N-methyltransferase SETDB1-A-like [Cheilinus undulatus]XP_041663980.1 histone-lysine N-methyltransferase SETDB1-A-like [Cheilinus undulatus]
METDEFEMCKDDLQKWIRERVKKQLISTGVPEKYRLVQSLLKRRKEQTTQLLRLCNSVAAFEAVVKKQYSLLGWEYRDTDSEDDNRDGDDDDDNFDDDHDKTKNFGNASPLQTPSPPSTKLLSPKLECNENPTVDIVTGLKRKPVVVLKKLPNRKAKTTCPPSPQGPCSETDSLTDADSDTHWEPEDNLSDSDYSVSSFTSGTQKRRNVERRNTKPTKRHAEFQASSMTAVKRVRKSPPQACTDSKDTEKSSAFQSAGAKINAKSDRKSPTQASTDKYTENNREKSTASLLAGAKTNAKCVRKSSTQASTDSNAQDNREKSSASQSAGAKIKAKTDKKSSFQTSMDSNAKEEKQKSPASHSAGAKFNAKSDRKSPTQACKDKNTKDKEENSSASLSAGAKTDAQSDRKSPTHACKDKNTKDKGEKSSASLSAGAKTDSKSVRKSPTQACKDKNTKDKEEKSSASLSAGAKTDAQSDRKSPTHACATSSNQKGVCQQSSAVAKITPADVPEVELSVNMDVYARWKAMRWLKGKIMEIISRDDRLRYKISFEMGKKILSGHHIALTSLPKVDQLDIGSRVVVSYSKDPPQFCPGIIAELPSRKNRSRFLIFCDDQTPHYVALPFLRPVSKPLKDSLDDIPDGVYKDFMREYFRLWPFPPQTSYRVGQTLNVEFEGVQQKCEVLALDSSLITIVFQSDQHKEKVYRGSWRLEHMVHMKKEQAERVEKKCASKKD